MIFLGAGASKVFGVKTMQDLTRDLVQKMRDKGYGETIDGILDALKHYEITPDFENIYTTLLALANLKEGIKKSGALTAYIASKCNFEYFKGDSAYDDEYENLLSEFRNLIYEECSIPRGVVENNRNIFDRLFKITQEFNETRILTSKLGTTGEVQISVGDTIATTNYDVAVELYHRWTSSSLSDGFKTTRKEYTKELDFYEYGRNPNSRWLIKLHGSIWQFKQEDKTIQTISDPKSLPLNISVGDQMMIYPVGEKPILQDPYFSFYSIFKEQPWQVLIAIGYSFRDEPVNTAILERLNSRPPPKAKLIVVNPQAEDVIANLGPLTPKLNERVIRISESFRDDIPLFEKIKTAIGASDWTDFKRIVGIKS